MTYTILKPKKELLNFIECIWISDFRDDMKKNQYTFADGCPEIVFKFKEADTEFDADHLVEKYVIGEKTKYKQFEVNRKDVFIGVKFKPGYLYSLIKMPMYEITDKSIFLDLIDRRLFPNFNDFKNKIEFCDAIQDRLMRLYEKNDMLDASIKTAVNMIILEKGIVDLKELSRDVCLHHRNLERKFRHYVGVSPKKLCKLVRFNNISKKIMTEEKINFVRLALDAGYSDQAHFNHDFKEFTGYNPTGIYSDMKNPQIIIDELL